jgi:2-polyprenyl-3-methyl-5-hydroxy-6-metoxy-1,4-benzoquinol methylase
VIGVARDSITTSVEEEKAPLLLEFDFTDPDLDFGQKYDFVWCFSVVHHIEDENIDDFVVNLVNSVAPGGTLVISGLMGKPHGENVGEWQGFQTIRRSFWYYKDFVEAQGMRLFRHEDVRDLDGNSLPDERIIVYKHGEPA